MLKQKLACLTCHQKIYKRSKTAANFWLSLCDKCAYKEPSIRIGVIDAVVFKDLEVLEDLKFVQSAEDEKNLLRILLSCTDDTFCIDPENHN